MAIQSYFFNAVESSGSYDRVYNAEDVCSYLDKIVGNGVFPDPSTSLQVRASSGMQVIVGAGQGWIQGHKMINTADLTLTLPAANSHYDRYDHIIFAMDAQTSQRAMRIYVKSGTPSASPSITPQLTRTSTLYELCLASIRVPAGYTSITSAMITDRRMDSTVCGMVQGLIQQVDTTTLWQQQDAEFHQWMTDVVDQYIEAGGAPVPAITKLYKNATNISSNGSDDWTPQLMGSFVVPKGLNHVVLRCIFNGNNKAGVRLVNIKKSTDSVSLMGEAYAELHTDGLSSSMLIIDAWLYVSATSRTYELYALQNSSASESFSASGELVNISPKYTSKCQVLIQ